MVFNIGKGPVQKGLAAAVLIAISSIGGLASANELPPNPAYVDSSEFRRWLYDNGDQTMTEEGRRYVAICRDGTHAEPVFPDPTSRRGHLHCEDGSEDRWFEIE